MDKPQSQQRNVIGDTVVSLIAGVVTVGAALALAFFLTKDVVRQLKELSDGMLSLMCLVTVGGVVGASLGAAGLVSFFNGRSNARLHEQNAQLHDAVVSMAQEQQHGMKVLAAYLMGKHDDGALKGITAGDRDNDEPNFEQIEPGHYVSTDSVIDDANTLRKLHVRGIVVTREVASGEGITDPARYKRAVRKLKQWGYVVGMSQGRAPEWANRVDDSDPSPAE